MDIDFTQNLVKALKKCTDEYETGYFRTKIYTNYNDRELSVETIKQICKSKVPLEILQDILCEWAMYYEIEYGLNELEKELKECLSKECIEYWNENSDKVNEWISEHHYFYYDENDFNNEVKVNIFIDTGDMNYDFTKCNILNYYASNGYGKDGTIDELSPIKWLAEQQGKFKEVQDACWYL